MPELFDWKPEFSVSVSSFDTQHKRLFSLAASLHQAMREGRGRQILANLLNDLILYTRSHFSSEEELLASNGYPLLESHRDEHQRLLQKVADFQKDFLAGNAHISVELMDFLQKWITNHILKTDSAYGTYLNRHGLY
jgi:hemerythrin